jgi:hypothetical protein
MTDFSLSTTCPKRTLKSCKIDIFPLNVKEKLIHGTALVGLGKAKEY